MKAETLEQFKTEVENKLFEKYRIGINDCTDDEAIERAFIDGESAQEFVDWIGDKYELNDLSLVSETVSKRAEIKEQIADYVVSQIDDAIESIEENCGSMWLTTKEGKTFSIMVVENETEN